MTIWFFSDPHFGHENMASVFTREDGTPVRGFASAREMDATIVDAINASVRHDDHLYCLGDVTMNPAGLARIMPKIVCKNRRLILGNHDKALTRIYAKHFQKVFGSRLFGRILMTHYPIAPWSFGKALMNVHGHVHQNRPFTYDVVDPMGEKTRRYLNLCPEVAGYQPWPLEALEAYQTLPAMDRPRRM